MKSMVKNDEKKPSEPYVLVGYKDHESGRVNCEHCGQVIRYEFYLKRPSDPGMLRVGSTCVEYLDGAPTLEISKIVAELKKKDPIKKRAQLKNKVASKVCTFYINVKGNYRSKRLNTTVFKSGPGWSWVFEGKWSNTNYKTPEEAMASAALYHVLQKNPELSQYLKTIPRVS